MLKRKKYILTRLKNTEKARKVKLMKKKDTKPLEEEFVETGQECEPESSPVPSTFCETTPPPTRAASRTCGQTSAEKRKAFSSPEIQPITNSTNVLIKKTRLEELARNISCSSCLSSTMECVTRQTQIDVSVKFVCTECKFVALDTKGDSDTGNAGIGKRTVMLVYVVMLLGWWYRGLEKVCAYLNVPHFGKVTFSRYRKFITSKAVEHTDKLLTENRVKVVDFYENTLDRHPDTDRNLNVDVMYLWHTHGHKSQLGAGVIVDANTGLILDYQTMSKYCELCTKKKKSLGTAEAFDEWHVGHASECHENHLGLWGALESAAAVLMWERSLSYNLGYKTFISDGDSSAYIAVKNLNDGNGPYGEEHQIAKEECINHVSKRLGTALRKLSKQVSTEVTADGSKKRKRNLGSCNQLTENVIRYLTRYFGIAVRRKRGTSPAEMRDDILSSFYHCSSSDENPKHHLCPTTKDSWCFYNKALANNDEPKSHQEMKIQFQLAADELTLVKEVYDRLTEDDMMQKCLAGRTQNLNESLHSRIWRICPKHKNANKPMLDFAVAQAVANYNTGYANSCLDSIMDIPRTTALHRILKEQDRRMDITPKKKMQNKRLQEELVHEAGSF